MDNLIHLHSGDFSATINPLGAELCSFKHEPSGTEFIWQAEPVWPRHAPVLFPFVGRLKNFEYRYNGKSFSIEQHGFARDLMFELQSKEGNSAVLELTNNDHTWQRYPFYFSFTVSFTLEESKLTMGFEVINKSNVVIPFSFGGHPAFNITDPEDAIIEFENDASPHAYLLHEGLISERTINVTDKPGKILINHQTFNEDALIFKNLKSNWVKLQSKSSPRSVTVGIEGWPYLGIWAKPGANFICIEPWQGIADNLDFDGEVDSKEGIVPLPPNQTYSKNFSMVVSGY